MRYLDKIIQYCEQAKQTQPERIFVYSKAEPLDLCAHYIYVIEQVGGDIQQSYDDFAAFKARKTHACAKLNQPNTILYVGSSRTGVHKRLKQHLGFGPKGTYALHMNEWFQGEYQISLRQYPATIAPQVLQLLEDDLAQSLKPAFGKLGANHQ
ncbi:hypothetical protein B9T33_13530 [Acinetobacter sp. ANC 5054]|uniref:hypothetical protein n=1 Tax=Acinetobacter sp. ANC 5054 TaxID=1977877 RepID=UPI000A35844F|nr:hypothetical protein [Acinetobacter sp. ANC 5054]OTG78981.1 hypothetical protein B9T33_13530 [Acinetobacter sp. ANC 5054]